MNMRRQDPPPPTPQDGFATILRQIADGDCINEMSEKFDDLVAKLEEQARSGNAQARGSITLKIDLKCEKNFMQAAYSIATRDPVPVRPGSMFFVRDGHLSRQDTRQLDNGLRDVSPPRPEQARDAASDTGEQRNV
jgi:hypothetical protein